MPCVGLQCVIMVFANHTHFIFCLQINKSQAQFIRKFTHCQGRQSFGSVVVDLLFNVLPIVCVCLCFVMHYFVSILVLKSS